MDEEAELQGQEEEVPGLGIAILAERGGAFDWLAEDPDLYNLDDLKVRYRQSTLEQPHAGA